MNPTFWSFLLILISAVTLSSQNYNRLEMEIVGIDYLVPNADNLDNAIGVHSEFRVNLNDRFSVGLSSSFQFFGELFDESVRSLGITSSLALNPDVYIFNRQDQRLFAGLGLGVFDNTETSESGMELGGNGLGIIPRIGYEWQFIRLTAGYNYSFKQDFPNYFSLGMGLNFGGRYIGA